jgi:hypothetical protein
MSGAPRNPKNSILKIFSERFCHERPVCDCDDSKVTEADRRGSLSAIEACNTWDGLLEWLLVMGFVVLILATPWVADLFRHFGDRGDGPPTHPLPVTSHVETSRTTGHSEESASVR